MTDTHAHILPGVDDGPKTVEDSVALLRRLAEQGVTDVAATPHFKPAREESIDAFLARRDAAEAALREAIKGREDLPRIHIGTEVTLCVDLAKYEGLEKLCYRNGNFLLIELDPDTVGSWIPNTLYEISNRLLLTPVIAHVDRYFDRMSPKLIEEIVKLNCPLQFNGYALAHFRTRRQLLKLMNKHPDTIFVVGSDCHDIKRRPPEMDLFEKKALKYLGEDYLEELYENSQLLLEGKLIT